MTSFTWQDSYSIEVPGIDEQHRNLFKLAGALQDAALAGKGKEDLRKLLHRLLEGSQQHFATEEGLMLASGFEDYARHKHQHALFVQKAVNLAQEFEAGRADLLSTLLPFLSRWMGHHITHEDRRLGPHLNAQRS